MKMPVAYSSNRGQTSIEYLLLLAVVAVIVIASFSPGSLISKVHDSAQDYYNTVTRVIMGNGNETIDGKKIKPIDGGWCPVTGPSGSGPTVMYRSCECPAPAFGGKACTDPQNPNSTACGAGQTCNGAMVTFQGVTACGQCPTGQVCNSAGVCGCPNSLVCGSGSTPKGSIPSTDCSQCICPQGTTYSSTNNSCSQNCTQPCTTWNGTSCVAVTCGANMWCNPAVPSNLECQCDSGSYYVGPGCAYCQACYTYNGTSCVPVTCGANMWCNPAMPAAEECQCYSGAHYVGPGCSY